MLYNPCSDNGRLQGEIQNVENKVRQCAQSHELSQTNSNVDRLEHQHGEISSAFNELRSKLNVLQEDNERLNRILEEHGIS